MKYIALRDFDGFKKGDSIPAEKVEDRLIRGKKIGLVGAAKREEPLNEVVGVVETKEEILTEDSSDVSVTVVEEDVEEILEEKPKKSKK